MGRTAKIGSRQENLTSMESMVKVSGQTYKKIKCINDDYKDDLNYFISI